MVFYVKIYGFKVVFDFELFVNLGNKKFFVGGLLLYNIDLRNINMIRVGRFFELEF